MIIAIAKDTISGARWLKNDKDYWAIITLDVKIAFNSADWDATLTALDGKDVLQYLLEFIVDYY